MGSHGDVVLHCCWCECEGKCLLDEYLGGYKGLWDVDGVGVMCSPCLELKEPPNFNNRRRVARWLSACRLLPRQLQDPGLEKGIADFLAPNISEAAVILALHQQ